MSPIIFFALLSLVGANPYRSTQECVQRHVDGLSKAFFDGFEPRLSYTRAGKDDIEFKDARIVFFGQVVDSLKSTYEGIGKSTSTEEFVANKRLAKEIVDSKIDSWISKVMSAMDPPVESSAGIEMMIMYRVLVLRDQFVQLIEEHTWCCFEAAGCTPLNAINHLPHVAL